MMSCSLNQWIFRKWDGWRKLTGLIWLRSGTGGGYFLHAAMNLRVPYTAENRLASQEGLCSMKHRVILTYIVIYCYEDGGQYVTSSSGHVLTVQ